MSMSTPESGRAPLAEATFGAVIFDMDGTLLNSTAAVQRSWARWAQEHGIDPQTLRESHGRTARAIVSEFVPAERAEAALARINELELADTEGVSLHAGVREALDAVQNARWAVATSCTRALAEARLAAAGLPLPQALITADDVQNSKPDPEAFLLAAERLGVAPGRCLVVEDAENGVRAARAARMPVMAVGTTMTWGHLQADVVVPDLSVAEFQADGERIHVTVWGSQHAQD